MKTLTLEQYHIIAYAVIEAAEGAIHFEEMGGECPHCKFQEALKILDEIASNKNPPPQCDQCGMIQPVYLTCACGNTIGI